MKKIVLFFVFLAMPVFSKVVMVSDMDLPPYIFESDNEIDGFEHELLQGIANINGWDFEELKLPFSEFFPALEDGRAQLIVSGMVKTPQREENYLLSLPYAYEKDVVMYLNHNYEVSNNDDLFSLKIAGLGEGAQTEALFALGFPRDNFVAVDSLYLAFRELLLGNVDGILAYEVVLNGMLDGLEGTYRFYELDTPDREVVAIFDKNNNALKKEFDSALEIMKEDGRYDMLYKKWIR